jgi:hypothetical protein
MCERRMVIEVIDDEMAEILRRMTPAQKLSAANDMWRYARQRLVAHFRREHPDRDEKAINVAVSRRLLGSDWPARVP